ncbi:MAG: DUF1194 domain-containing protein [Alphaproteobacteria bacterium]|nr:DUF1194 domain-containing protein [Alphaproteobacteria bacterium]
MPLRYAVVPILLVAIGLSVGISRAVPAEIEAVDLELILAADVSGSVDEREAHLQREGYQKALVNDDVIKAIEAGMLGRIAVTYVEWAGLGHYKVVVDWSVIHDKASAEAFVAKLTAVPIQKAHRTSISDAIDLSVPRFAANRFQGTRRIIDISGDGANNYGRLVNEARDAAVAAGITINGLPIITDQASLIYPTIADLDLFFHDCVIGGPGAFHVVANGFDDFARAVRKKMILEIAGTSDPWVQRVVNRPRSGQHWRIWRAAEREPIPCNIGEWRWMSIMMGGTRE